MRLLDRALIGSVKVFLNARNFPFPTPGENVYTDLHVFTCKSYSAYQNILDHLNLWTVGCARGTNTVPC